MSIFVLEIKKVTATRCTNDGVAACYWDGTLTYCAPRTGPLVRSVAVEADDIDSAFDAAMAELNEARKKLKEHAA